MNMHPTTIIAEKKSIQISSPKPSSSSPRTTQRGAQKGRGGERERERKEDEGKVAEAKCSIPV